MTKTWLLGCSHPYFNGHRFYYCLIVLFVFFFFFKKTATEELLTLLQNSTPNNWFISNYHSLHDPMQTFTEFFAYLRHHIRQKDTTMI